MRRLSLFEAARQYFQSNPRIRSDHTEQQYLWAIRNFRDTIGREPTIRDLSDEDVLAMIDRLRELGLAAKTINERRGRLNALWSWCAKRGFVNTWPTVGPITEPKRVPLAWSKDQLSSLLQACVSERIIIDGVPSPKWWRTLHLAMWDTGERITALLSAKWELLEGPWITIPAEQRKGKRKDMVYRLAPGTLEELQEIRNPERQLIWPWPYCRSYLWVRYKLIRKRAGLPVDRRSSFHRMRRSVASWYEAAGGNATELLAHESRRVTQSYLDPRITGQRQASDLLFRISEN